MLKLKTITFECAPRIPGIRPGDMSTLDCVNPVGQMRGWAAVIRGPSMFLISPPGWDPNKNYMEWDRTAPSTVHEVPRSNCYFQWHGTYDDVEAFVKAGRHETPAFGGGFEYPKADTIAPPSAVPTKAPSILSQLED